MYYGREIGEYSHECQYVTQAKRVLSALGLESVIWCLSANTEYIQVHSAHARISLP